MEDLKYDIEKYWGQVSNWNSYQESYFPKDLTAAPHKRSQWLVDQLKELKFNSILEIGSGCGRNLFHISKAFPDVRVAGLDISADAIEFSKKMLNGDFYVGSMRDLKQLVVQKYDVVFSMASLCFVDSKEFEMVMSDLKNITGKYAYHFEHMGNGQIFQGESKSQLYWLNNYRSFYQKKNIKCVDLAIPSYVVAPALNEGIFCDLGQVHA